MERSGGVKALLLDEPNAWVAEQDYPRLIDEIRERASRSAVVLSTHNLAFGKACADYACLLGEGGILASADTKSFFSSDSPYVRHLLRIGSVWPGAVMIPPPGFQWVTEGRLGGMPQPGLTRPVESDLDARSIQTFTSPTGC